jgi:hypothetical protein
MSGDDSPSHVSLGFGWEKHPVTDPERRQPIFSASRATWRIVSGETIDPYCGSTVPIETLGVVDRLEELVTMSEMA